MTFLSKCARTTRLILLVGLLIHSTPAQQDNQHASSRTQHSKPDCPKPSVKLDSSKWVGKRMHHVLSAGLLEGKAKQNLSYQWSISPGTITSGQGSSLITVEMPECMCDFKVEVVIGGLEADCNKVAGFSIVDICFYPIGIFKYREPSSSKEQERLHYFATLLQQQPCTRMEMVAYDKRGDQTGEAIAMAEKTRDLIVKKYGFSRERITVIEGGVEDERKVEVYLLPHLSSRQSAGRP